MRTHLAAHGVTAVLLGVLLVSCGASRHAVPTRPEELVHRVLVLRALPDGTATHSWQHSEAFDLSRYGSASKPSDASGRIVLAMNSARDCDEELAACMQECMSRPLPRGFGHITSRDRKKGGKAVYCNRRCMQPYLDCSELKELRPQELTAIDGAVDWLKRNHKALLVGSMVIIAGVVFVVVSAGAGLVVLAPAVLLTSSATSSDPSIAAVSP